MSRLSKHTLCKMLKNHCTWTIFLENVKSHLRLFTENFRKYAKLPISQIYCKIEQLYCSRGLYTDNYTITPSNRLLDSASLKKEFSCTFPCLGVMIDFNKDPREEDIIKSFNFISLTFPNKTDQCCLKLI